MNTEGHPKLYRTKDPVEYHKMKEKAFNQTEIAGMPDRQDAFFEIQQEYLVNCRWKAFEKLEYVFGTPGFCESCIIIVAVLVWGVLHLTEKVMDFDDDYYQYSYGADAERAFRFKVSVFPLALGLVAFFGFRLGYFGSKYINLALKIFHRFSLDDVISGTMSDEKKSIAEPGCSAGDKCKTRQILGTVLTYLLEFVQAVQICLPVMSPYIRSANNRGQKFEEGGLGLLHVVNLDIIHGEA